MNQFELDFNKIWEMIESGTNFAYARYADGEILLMNGQSIGRGTQAYNVDKWGAPNCLTNVGQKLAIALKHTEPNYYYAISGKNDNISDYQYLKSQILQPDNNITFANLWINHNYQNMLIKYRQHAKPTYVICNEVAKKENFPFPVIDIIPFPNDCINYWELFGDRYITELIDKYGNVTNQTFFISCGPISEIIIHELFNNNPNNQYIDMGSSMDEFVHLKKTRPFMEQNSPYSKHISSF